MRCWRSRLARYGLGRGFTLFLGNDDAGLSLAVLMSLACTAVAHGINPETYLADVLIRVQTTPVARIDELLPQNWVVRVQA